MSSLPTPGRAGFWATARNRLNHSQGVRKASREVIMSGLMVAAAVIALRLLEPGTLTALVTVWSGVLVVTAGVWMVAVFHDLVATAWRTAASLIAGLTAGAIVQLVWQLSTTGDDLGMDVPLDHGLSATAQVTSSLVATMTGALLLLALCAPVAARPAREGRSFKDLTGRLGRWVGGR